ncbi:MAG: histidine--tRNA ligase [Candidatus Woesearchaeota archaeon]|nr:MAG: histidine--tRNA ligase [Candidatus Woesearchaeota archaeon]
MVNLDIPKGTRDFLPKEKIIRQKIVDVFRETFEEFGYNPLETPSLELLKVATYKGGTQAGTDTYKEIYKLKDQAKRKLSLRYELTFPLARVVSMYKQLPIPFKRYQIGRTWRDGPIKTGRYREFWQCDVDIVGTDSIEADAEILALYTKVFEKLKLKVVIKISNRKLLDGILEFAGVPKNKKDAAMISIDKLEKIGRDAVLDDAKERGLDEDSMIKALDMLEQEGSNSEIIKNLSKFVSNEKAKEGLEEIKELLKLAKNFGAKNVEFVPSLARGLSYYTGPVFEVFLKSRKLKSSLAAGGRWDDMIGNFSGSKEKIPATGTSFGLDTIYDALILEKKADLKTSLVQVYVIPVGNTRKEAAKVASELRESGINTDLDLVVRGISKNLTYVNKQDIPYVIFIGEKELKQKKIKLRDMKTGKEKLITIKQVIKELS